MQVNTSRLGGSGTITIITTTTTISNNNTNHNNNKNNCSDQTQTTTQHSPSMLTSAMVLSVLSRPLTTWAAGSATGRPCHSVDHGTKLTLLYHQHLLQTSICVSPLNYDTILGDN
ncbi:hypothetical protein E2C01_002707 [Portunus trituberculatus]|uniref:Uncharacterized protein n=1 Tax=Portunus trituberculatus TaxID=210409 RepID=A0A5B7CL11_PORTR|nr:hypothetical protein [Portunus trituberculatus]